MKLSGRVISVMAVGAAVTIGAVATGLTSLQRRNQAEGPSREELYFLDEARLQAGLVASEVFSSPRIGYAGRLAPITSEFMTVMADVRAEEKLLELVSQGAPGGLLYGLCGLRILGSKHLDPTLLFVSRHDARRVALMRGCVHSVMTPRDVVRSPAFENVCAEWTAVAREAVPPKLPDLSPGSAVPQGAHDTGVGIMVSPAQFQREWAWRFDGAIYSLGVDDRGIVQYVSTPSNKVMTKEGVHVGQSFSDVQRVAGVRVLAWPGWGYVAELPSGWNAAFFIGKSMTEREPVAEDAVALLFRGTAAGYGAGAKD